MEAGILDPLFTHPPPRKLLAMDLHGDRKVLDQRVALLVDRRRVHGWRPRAQQQRRMPEDPRVADRPPRDPYDVHSRLPPHPHRVLRREHIARAQDRAIRILALEFLEERPP
jgi:hypothetical protein